MELEQFMKLLEKAKKDEYGNLYIENRDINGPLLNNGADDEYDHMRWYFSLSNTVCEDMVKCFCGETNDGYELYDRHFINDDTLQIKIVREKLK